MQESKKSLREELNAVNKSRDNLRAQLREMKSKVGILSTPQKIDEKIAALEYDITHNTLDLKQEEKVRHRRPSILIKSYIPWWQRQLKLLLSNYTYLIPERYGAPCLACIYNVFSLRFGIGPQKGFYSCRDLQPTFNTSTTSFACSALPVSMSRGTFISYILAGLPKIQCAHLPIFSQTSIFN